MIKLFDEPLIGAESRPLRGRLSLGVLLSCGVPETLLPEPADIGPQTLFRRCAFH